ncbi:MAG TPA: twitching motility protein PilT [Gammaproteobacteria bacterium]|nr:twitching motility protein PilT [Gammaproteobacteria bacterium]
MASARFRFYAELNDFLPPERRQVEFEHRFERRSSIKDMIESLGVPHPEVELILVNGRSVDFSYIVRDGDRISVYPVFERLDVSPRLRLRPEPLRDPRFVVDCNLGRLARYLRLLGFDCLYRNDYSDDDVATISQQQHRIVLTRDRRLLHRRIIDHGLFVRSDRPKEQVREVLKRLDLYRLARPLSRCTRCNGRLQRVRKARVDAQLEPKTRLYYDDFLQCEDCGQVYWAGSHHRRLGALIEELLTPPPE